MDKPPDRRTRYTAATRTWTLYWRDRQLRFHLYDRPAPSPSFDDLFDEIARDSARICSGLTGTCGGKRLVDIQPGDARRGSHDVPAAGRLP
jgi:hypothetical protein